MPKRSAALDDLVLDTTADDLGKAAATPWRVCLVVGASLAYGFATPVRFALSKGLAWAHDWLAQRGDPHHRAHDMAVKMRQGGGDWKPGTRQIVLAFAAVLILGAAWQLGKRKAGIGQNPMTSFFVPSRRAAIITAIVVIAPSVIVVALAHWQPTTGAQVMHALAAVAGPLATFTGRNGW